MYVNGEGVGEALFDAKPSVSEYGRGGGGLSERIPIGRECVLYISRFYALAKLNIWVALHGTVVKCPSLSIFSPGKYCV